MIQLKNVSFSYNKDSETLKNININIHQGECVLLCGASGCGKTTITKLINGLIPNFTPGCEVKGTVKVSGLDVAATPMYCLAERVGSVFQNPKSQFFNTNSDAELAFGLENRGEEPDIIQKNVDKAVKELGAWNLLNRDIFSMSGGEKQMLAFASVYAMSPKVIVLDEPTANLDDVAISKLREVLFAMKSKGMTIVIAEHRLYFLRDLVDRVIFVEGGGIAKEFNQAKFFAMSNGERILMGLRVLEYTSIQLQYATKTVSEIGLTVKNLVCTLKGQGIIHDLSFCAIPGDVVAIAGANGAGKSTLARCLCGLIEESSGEICYKGKRLKKRSRQKLCAMVMQDVNHQLFYDSVWNECESAAQTNPEKIEDALGELDLIDLKDSHPMALSGGQKQRLAIVCAILSGKKVLIFDEPTSGLDYGHMLEVSKTIKLLAKQGCIILIVSHDTEFLNLTCNSIIKIGEGGVSKL